MRLSVSVAVLCIPALACAVRADTRVSALPAAAGSGLTVRVVDAASRPLAGAWVELGSRSDTARPTDASGCAVFADPGSPVDVHVFPPQGRGPQLVSVLGVTGATLRVAAGEADPAAAASDEASLTASLRFQGGGYLGAIEPFDAQGSAVNGDFFIQGQGQGAADIEDAHLEPGTTAYFSAIATDPDFTRILGAVFAPPQRLVAPHNALEAAAGAAGWVSGTCSAGLQGLAEGESWKLTAYAGSGPGAAWIAPGLATGVSRSGGSFGTFAYPASAEYFDLEFSGAHCLPGPPFEIHRRSLGVRAQAWPATLDLALPAEVRLTEVPSRSRRRLTAACPGGRGEGWWTASVRVQGGPVEWELRAPLAAVAGGIRAEFPPLPAAVTWIEPFPGNVVRIVEAGVDAYAGPNDPLEPSAGPRPARLWSASAYLFDAE